MTRIWYSVQNGGDGSAYPKFMESGELAEWDQEHMYEGWGESCTGSISIESNSEISCKDIVSKEEYLIEYMENEDDNLADFIDEFFPNGLPTFRVETEEAKGKYLYNKVFINDEVYVCKVFRNKKDSGKKFEKMLNSLGVK